MKTKKCYRKTILLGSLLFFLQSFPLSSQLLETMDWKIFVESSSNYLVCNTFFRQTFEGRPSDLWEYGTTGNPSLFDAAMAGITGQEGNTSLKLPIGSSVRFDNPFALYSTTLTVKFAGCNLRVNDGLRLSISRGDVPQSVIWALSKKDGSKINYGDKTDGKPGQTNMANPMQLSGSPQYIHLESIASQAPDDNSFFCIDEVYGYGDIPCYSLFSGDERWTEMACWSHLPPSSQRKALLEGTCRLDQTVVCKELHLKGELFLEEGGVCKVENCYLYDIGAFNFQGSTIIVENKTCVLLELPEKGTWYFFSLPFDVYPEGLDPDMQWGKGSTNENGNFFYLMRYDSESRANNGLSSSNWQQLSVENHFPDKPLLKKGKGYLIALDEHSDRKHLTFTSRQGERISYSGKDFIRLEGGQKGRAGQAHQGWHLCGNPFPAPLLLEHIAVNETLDRHVYFYEEDEYQAYPLKGKYTIPPYAAFL
ncbi:MAG: hypothetical protein LUD02_03930 [Tannerellaceae bacterium]|nr:hypothetical protein [Tannerellaceae bacterium]